MIQFSRREPEHFDVLFRRHAPNLQRYVVRRLGPDAADDIVAETFLLAFRHRDRYDAAHADARPWLYGIATNLIGRHRRAEVRRYRALARTGADPVTEPFTDRVDDRVSAGHASRQLATALARLPAESRDTLLRAGTAHQGTERVTTRSRRRPFVILGLDLRWRLVIAAGLAAALAAGLVAAFQLSGPAPVLTARLLAARASAAALGGPVVPGGQWIYQRTVSYTVSPPKGYPARLTQGTWSTADGSIQYLGSPWAFGPGHALYSTLGSLPRDPAALDEYLARLSYPDGKETRAAKVSTQFLTIEELLASAILPPAVNAALYRALGVIPGVQVKPHVTDIAGRAGIAFVLPKTPQSANLEIILDASDYHYLAQAAWQPSDGSPNSAIPFTESALLRTTLVSGPGSTAADPDPPSQAMLTAERAMMTMLTAQKPAAPALPDPRQWIYRKLGTSGGTREVWARADDTEQASYVRGRLVTCARPARCAAATRWLVPAGPAFGTNALAASPRDLLDRLNAYRTGCVDVTGYCNAVGVFASTLIGYDNVDTTPFVWYFSLAYVPGVTVKRITDAAGRADVEFRFPFSGGVTGILLDARTYGFAGYGKDGAQTLLLRQADVSGPGVRP